MIIGVGFADTRSLCQDSQGEFVRADGFEEVFCNLYELTSPVRLTQTLWTLRTGLGD